MKLQALVIAFVALTVVLPNPAGATVAIANEMRATAEGATPGLELYQYGTGTPKVADFTTGTHSSTLESTGSLELDFGDWWDTDWQQRQCFEVTSIDAEPEYPIRFEVDTSASATTGADIRVVDDATGTVLTSYSEGPFPAADSVVWAQAEPLPAGVSTYCVYFDNPPAPTVSDEIGVFTFDAGQTVAHYTLSDRHFGGAGNANSFLTVVSYSDGNVVSDGISSVSLNTGQTHTFTGTTEDTVITSTGPIEANYDRDGRETPIPEGYADTRFSFPTRRYDERFWVRSPHANTTIEAVSDGVVIASVPVGPADGSVVLDAPGVGNDPVSVRSTTGADFVAMHIGTNRQDSMIGVPWFGDTLFGVPSRVMNLGAFVPTTVSWMSSDGSSNPAQAIAINTLTTVSPFGAFGDSHAVAVSGPDYFHVAQQADSDATEVTSFIPERLLGQTFRTPVSSRYFTIACPVPGTMIQVDGGPAAPCNGIGVGRYYSGFGFQAAGTLVEADHPIFMYYETSGTRNETNLLGPRGNLPYTSSVTNTASAVEELVLCGTWTSALLPASGVFGRANVQSTQPTDTTTTLQISTDGSPFYGPDGTAATSFADGDIVPYSADFASTVQFQIELCTTDGSVTPVIDSFEIECDLIEPSVPLDNVIALTIPSPAAGTDEPLFRVYQQSAGSWLGSVRYAGGTNLAASGIDVSTDHPTTQITSSGGTVTDPSPTFSHLTGEPYTISIEHKTTAGASSTFDFAVVSADGVLDEVGVSLTLVG